MLVQRRLDLERADQVPGGLDDVVAASDEPVVAVGVTASQVAGAIPAVDEARPVSLVLVEVAAEHRRPARCAGPARRNLPARSPRRRGHPGSTTSSPSASRASSVASMPGQRPSHRPGPHGLRSAVGDHDAAGLGLPPGVEHGHAEHLLRPRDRFGVERFADAGDQPERPGGRTVDARSRRQPLRAFGSRSVRCSSTSTR